MLHPIRIHHQGIYHQVRVNHRQQISFAAVLVTLGIVLAACSTSVPTNFKDTTSRASTTTMIEYVDGHWVRFTSRQQLSAEQWSVVDAYANFSSAVLAVYATRSVAPLATVVSAQSKVTAMFTRDLATGINPEALYVSATVEQVSISGCRARLTLELYYPGGRRLHYVSSWVRPFDRVDLAHKRPETSGYSTPSTFASNQYAPWQFVGDNRVGGVNTPCGL